MSAGRLDPVGDADHEQDEPGGESDVAGPVDLGVVTLPELLQLQVRPDRSEQPERHGDQEDQPPVDRGQHAAEDQADERSADARDVVDAESQAALVRGECVGQDGGGIGHQECGADALEDAADDQPVGSVGPVNGSTVSNSEATV